MASRTLVSTGVGLIVLGVAASAYAGPQGRLGSTEIAGGGTLTCFGGSDIEWNELNFICNGDAMPPVGSLELIPFTWDEVVPPLQPEYEIFIPVNPVGPFEFGVTDIPAYVGHVFDTGNMTIRAKDVTGAFRG